MVFRSIQDVEHALLPYYEVVSKTTGQGITVDRMVRLMAHLGNPEKSLRVVHIAGTSGKTSTTQYIAALLHTNGQKVGHTVSPHVLNLTERVQIDGSPLDEQAFCAYMSEFLELVRDAPDMPSWFELMMGFALWTFAKERVEYAVLETGMGGLHDATNVCSRYDKLCVITDIGLDHMRWLGDTVAQIAGQKSGIIHPGNAVLMYEQGADIMRVVKFKVSQTEDSELYVQHQDLLARAYGKNLAPNMPLFQIRNWLLAYSAYRFLQNRDGFSVVDEKKIAHTQQLVLGRMQTVVFGGKTIVLDAAHNEPKMRAFVDSFRHLYGKRKVPVLLALKEHKETEVVVPILSEIVSDFIVTEFAVHQDFWQTESQKADAVAIIAEATKAKTSTERNVAKALETLLQHESKLVVVTGSIYLLGLVLRVLREKGAAV